MNTQTAQPDTSASDIPNVENAAAETAPANDRDALRMKIEAAERRIEERSFVDQAREAAETGTEYVKANPLKAIGGAIAVGLVIGLLTPPGRRAARTAVIAVGGAAGQAGSAASDAVEDAAYTAKKKTSRFGSMISNALVAYGVRLIDEAMDTAQKGQDKLEDFGDSASDTARNLRREASYMAANAADKGRTASRRSRRRAERAVRDLTRRVGK